MSNTETEELRRRLAEYERREEQRTSDRFDSIEEKLDELKGMVTTLTGEFKASEARIGKLEETEKTRSTAALAAGGGIGGFLVAVFEAFRNKLGF